LAIDTFTDGGFGVIIDPTAPSTLATHFYKKNMCSSNIHHHFLFSRPQRVHDALSQMELLNKLKENEDRRTGKKWDNYNKVYGWRANSHNEVLLTYTLDSVLGIQLTESSNVTEALKFRNKVWSQTKKPIHFYQYDSERGEMRVVPESVIQQYLRTKNNNAAVVHDSKPPYPGLTKNYQDFLTNKDRTNITNMTCSLADHSPSTENPVKYQFNAEDKINTKKKLKCEAYFENGFPLISVNGSKFSDRKYLMPRVAKIYQLRQLDVCNDLLKNENIKNYLGVRDITLTMSDDDKEYLVLCYKSHYSLRNHTYNILQEIGYDTDQCKFELMNSEPGEIKIRLSVIQALDSIAKQLTSLTESLKAEPARKKTRRTYG